MRPVRACSTGSGLLGERGQRWGCRPVGRMTISLRSTEAGCSSANMTVRATSPGASLGSPARPGSGCPASVSPGWIKVTRMPVAVASARMDWAMAVTAHLVAEYSCPGTVTRPAAEPVRIRCPRAGISAGRAARGQRGAVDVGQHHFAPLLRGAGAVQEGCGREGACVGEDGIEAAEGVQGGGGERADLVPVADIAAGGAGCRGAAQFGGELVDRVPGAGGQHQPPAPADGQPRCGCSDAGGRAGDDENRWCGHVGRWLQVLGGRRRPSAASIDGDVVLRSGPVRAQIVRRDLAFTRQRPGRR